MLVGVPHLLILLSLLTNPLLDEVTRISTTPLLAEAFLTRDVAGTYDMSNLTAWRYSFVHAWHVHLCVLVTTQN